MTQANQLSKAAGFMGGGTNQRELLAGNRASAELARQAKAIMDGYEFTGQDEEIMRGKAHYSMLVSRVSGCGDMDSAFVFCAKDDLDQWDAMSLYPTDFPLAAYVLAVRTRVMHNAAKAAARQAEGQAG